VADAVRDWLAFGLSGRDIATVVKCTILANPHVIPALGARKLRDLSADDIDRWLGRPSKSLTFRQAEAFLDAAQGSSLDAYIVLSFAHRRPYRGTSRAHLVSRQSRWKSCEQ
jgi:hypothetical protein